MTSNYREDEMKYIIKLLDVKSIARRIPMEAKIRLLEARLDLITKGMIDALGRN